jgi:hypothetical protein
MQEGQAPIPTEQRAIFLSNKNCDHEIVYARRKPCPSASRGMVFCASAHRSLSTQQMHLCRVCEFLLRKGRFNIGSVPQKPDHSSHYQSYHHYAKTRAVVD